MASTVVFLSKGIDIGARVNGSIFGDIRTIQELLGHNTLKTTMILTHAASANFNGPKSPLDQI